MPEGQLLEMDLSEGWGPLCKVLDVSVPNEQFPRTNDAAATDSYATKVLLKVLGVCVGIFSATGIVLYSGVWLWKNTLFWSIFREVILNFMSC